MLKLIISFAAALTVTSAAHGQLVRLDRLSDEMLQVLPPSARVDGAPGDMRITESSCRTLPRAEMRRRIVDIAVQEWGFFGFPVLDQTTVVETEPRPRRTRRRTPWLNPEESARVAGVIAGYWSTTPDGRWILSRQNEVWNGYDGVAARWRDPWSAAFVSWVMCEGGLGDRDQFRRAIAHHSYIDQAIEARDKEASQAAYVAFDVGEMLVEPGDLLCSSWRPAYASIAERRRELRTGIRSHCDIVIRLDSENKRILVIGGNVRGAVRMKLLPADFELNQGSQLVVKSAGQGRRTVFAHLKLRADSIEADPLENSPTLRALSEHTDGLDRLREQLQPLTL
jgi:hypothetical protein